MNLLQFSGEISKLFLKYDKSETWIGEKQVFIWWNIFFFSGIFLIIVTTLVFVLKNGFSVNPKWLSLYFRVFRIAFVTFLIYALITLSFKYYRFILLKSKDLEFNNIAFFCFSSLFLFTALYCSIYSLSPSSFNYSNPPYIISEIAETNSKNFIILLDFILYSALTSFTFNYYKIASSSVYISLINIIQIIYSIILITVFIGTFIQKLDILKK